MTSKYLTQEHLNLIEAHHLSRMRKEPGRPTQAELAASLGVSPRTMYRELMAMGYRSLQARKACERHPHAMTVSEGTPAALTALPHADLRASWKPGQLWQVYDSHDQQWLTLPKYTEPMWVPTLDYRKEPAEFGKEQGLRARAQQYINTMSLKELVVMLKTRTTVRKGVKEGVVCRL